MADEFFLPLHYCCASMKRKLPFIICLFSALLLLGAGWLIPAHLRAVDASVIKAAGNHTDTLLETGQNLEETRNLSASQMLLRAAELEHIAGRKSLAIPVNIAVTARPAWMPLGGAAPKLESIFGTSAYRAVSTNIPFTEFILKIGNLDRTLEFLSASPNPVIKNLLECRSLTNLAVFPPSRSSSGQAFDAALCTCGLLVEEGSMSPAMTRNVAALCSDALAGGGSGRLEQLLLDYMSLGQRFDWNQLQNFNSRLDDAETLRILASYIRQSAGREPIIFSAVLLSRQPAEVAAYLTNFSKTGIDDLGASLADNAGGVRELLHRNLPISSSPLRQALDRYEPFATIMAFATDYCWRLPTFTLTLKWLMFLAAGFLLAEAVHFALPPPPALQRPLEVRGAKWAREFLFALGFLLVVLLSSEPFLARESQKEALPFRLHLSMLGGAATVGPPGIKSSFMNPSNVLTILLFFVLQGLLYIACLVKLGEVRRQRVPSRLKLRLLENEDHLFDAGLYLGFLGTIVSLILSQITVSHQLSFMVAYSSTSFGIVFVSIFKIFHLRPLRRQLVMEAEVESGELATTAVATAA